jgi:hypothetical protein
VESTITEAPYFASKCKLSTEGEFASRVDLSSLGAVMLLAVSFHAWTSLLL